jgi:tetratricopeptide (TPR) repeat protein
VVPIAAALGLSAIVAIGACKGGERSDPSTAAADKPDDAAPTDPTAAPAPGIDQLLGQAERARAALDVGSLEQLGDALRRAADEATPERRAAVQLELAQVLATQALEASIRSRTVEAQRTEAQQVAAAAIDAAGPVLEELERSGADPGRVVAARARVRLAAGDDVTEAYPAVLLPTYRDEELRLAALAGPLWRDANVPQEVVREIADALEAAEQKSGLVRVLEAVALQAEGNTEEALSIVDRILAEVPAQPLAQGLRAELTGEGPAVVAMAGETGQDEPDPAAAAVRGSGAIEDEPEIVEDEPEPEPTRPAPAQDEPEDEPTILEDEPAPAKPKSSSKPKKRSKPEPAAADYDTLVAEGCKKVRSGNAAAGFDMLQRAHDLQPGAVKVTVCMAEAHHKLGRAASARAMCDRALRKAPKNKQALLLMGKLEAERGNVAGALSHYRKVLEVDPENAAAKKYVESHGS